jgi:uncharacterized phiE125 gp8 family phage protein
MLRTIVPPAGYPVSLADAKAHLRRDGSDDDAYISALIAVATGMVESAIQRRLMTQTLEWVLQSWRPQLVLPVAPVQSITSITYIDTTNTPQTLELDPNAPAGPAVTILTQANKVLVPSYGRIWPLLYWVAPEPIVIRFVAGYADAADDDAPGPAAAGDEAADPNAAVPVELCHLIKLMVAHMYENREPAVLGNTVPQKLPFFDALLDPFRWEVAGGSRWS